MDRSNESEFDWLTTLLLCIFLGTFGIHRFYTKSTGIGLIQLFTLGGCGIWVLIDLIMIVVGSFRDGYDKILVNKTRV
jgi:TM2 domain-containing membrane protein YozV